MIRATQGFMAPTTVLDAAFLIALLAVQLKSQHGRPPFRRYHPGPVDPGRIMAHMLAMPTGQPGNPMLFFILVEGDDGLFHGERRSLPIQADQE